VPLDLLAGQEGNQHVEALVELLFRRLDGRPHAGHLVGEGATAHPDDEPPVREDVSLHDLPCEYPHVVERQNDHRGDQLEAFGHAGHLHRHQQRRRGE